MNKRPITINIDPGIDDAFVITITLFSDELNVRLISTVAGSIGLDKVTYNALRLPKYFGREGIPAAVSADRPLTREFEDTSSVRGKSGIEGFDFEELTQQPLKENAIDVMHNVVINSSKPVTLVPIVPLTNVALLLKTYPEVERNTREIVLMGGSASRGNKGVMAEFSIALDPKAAYVVFYSGVKLTMVGLGVGLKTLVLLEDSEEIRTMNKTGEITYCLLKKHRGESFHTGLKMYNATAVAYLLRPELFGAVETYLDVELYGAMTADCALADLGSYLEREPDATVCLDIDGNAFHIWFEEAITKCR